MIQYLPMNNEFLKSNLVRKPPVTDRGNIHSYKDFDLIHEEAQIPYSGNFRAQSHQKSRKNVRTVPQIST